MAHGAGRRRERVLHDRGRRHALPADVRAGEGESSVRTVPGRCGRLPRDRPHDAGVSARARGVQPWGDGADPEVHTRPRGTGQDTGALLRARPRCAAQPRFRGGGDLSGGAQPVRDQDRLARACEGRSAGRRGGAGQPRGHHAHRHRHRAARELRGRHVRRVP